MLFCIGVYLLLLLVCLHASGSESQSHDVTTSTSQRYAMIVTLAGPSKLSSYFEWTCRSISFAADKFDMLVFHESNVKLKELQCASNVKFIDLGPNGLANLIVYEIMSEFNSSSEANRGELTQLLSQVILHIPRYLIEIKPMTGSLFRDYLGGYSHWTYTDPDIIWGNIANWIDPIDAKTFDIITLAKNFDAGRLFIRGQFALHKNIEKINLLWKQLSFFAPNKFAQRVVTAVRMIKQQKSTDSIFQTNFHSAEGYYSQLVFKNKLLVKIIGRGYDDFNKDPVVLTPTGQLVRARPSVLPTLVREVLTSPQQNRTVLSVADLTPIVPVSVNSYYHKSACYMQWLPSEFRYCLATKKYDRKKERSTDLQLRLLRLGESYTLDGVNWQANDERNSFRQLKNGAAFFHFRHWDDFCSTGLDTVWESNSNGDTRSCMVVYIRSNSVLSFENCKSVLEKADSRNYDAIKIRI